MNNLNRIKTKLTKYEAELKKLGIRLCGTLENARYWLDVEHVNLSMSCYHIGQQANQTNTDAIQSTNPDRQNALYLVSMELGKIAGELSLIEDDKKGEK